MKGACFSLCFHSECWANKKLRNKICKYHLQCL